jgi:phage shock protein E
MSFPFGNMFAAFLATASPSSANPEAASPAVQHQQQQVPLIEVAALKSLMAMHGRFLLVDVRQPEEYAQGHIDGAVLMPLDALPARVAELPRDVKLVVYCRSGHRSAQAVTLLLDRGYSRAVSLNGGYLAWTAKP